MLVFLALSVTLIFNSFLAFGSAYFEHLLLQRFATFFCVLSMIGCVTLAVMNEIISALVLSKMVSEDGESPKELADSRFACFNTIAQFSQEILMNIGCPNKYTHHINGDNYSQL